MVVEKGKGSSNIIIIYYIVEFNFNYGNRGERRKEIINSEAGGEEQDINILYYIVRINFNGGIGKEGEGQSWKRGEGE